jgi:predicted transport protein
MLGGFGESPLKLNQGLGQLEQWNEDTIKARAQRLSEAAVAVWCAPQLAADVLTAYRPPAESTSGYSIEDHPHLLGGVGRELFEAFRKEVLALDPVVSEDFLKLYVAYKAETNFVDVVPQVKRLRLSLNMPFADIIDPRGLCKDVTGVGRWGNGDVEVGFTSLEELPYIMGLVREAFERQMGNESDS